MDEPTEAVATYLLKKFQWFPREVEEFMEHKFKELDEFTQSHYILLADEESYNA